LKPVIIIAEAGVNHNGSIEMAKQLIEVAASAGVDYVKFQTFKASNLVSASAKKADYQKLNMKNDTDNSQLNMLQQLELSYNDHLILIEHCNQYHIKFFSTAFDLESIDMLDGFGLELWKIPSGEITNLPYLEKIGGLKKDVIISTGMSTMEEIEEAINVLTKNGTSKEQITVLHCNTEYPTPMQDVNLKAMLDIQNKLNVKIGYSDHTLGIEIPIAATALGATIIEKHFTLDKNLEGPDHKASLKPNELKQMVLAIRNIEQALGNGIKKPSSSEIKNITIARKSIHLKHEMLNGQIISKDDLIMKRPGDGISPMKINDVVGKKVTKNLLADHKLLHNDIE
jgi:N-acetylneuraminate synthase